MLLKRLMYAQKIYLNKETRSFKILKKNFEEKPKIGKLGNGKKKIIL